MSIEDDDWECCHAPELGGGDCAFCPYNKDSDNYDPTPWCHICGAMEKKDCNCGDYAANH